MPINSFSPPRIVIDNNSPAHAESSPHVRRTLDINRESDIHAVAGTPQTPISIHALRKESDPGTLRLTKRSKNFNPHSPCGERPSPPAPSTRRANFNPHSPCGERPGADRRPVGRTHNFNPHSPCGERPWRQCRIGCLQAISIHTPLAGSDRHLGDMHGRRGRISIHTPLAGSDWVTESHKAPLGVFQSTLPLRGATKQTSLKSGVNRISIHTPLAGSDRRNETFLTK